MVKDQKKRARKRARRGNRRRVADERARRRDHGERSSGARHREWTNAERAAEEEVAAVESRRKGSTTVSIRDNNYYDRYQTKLKPNHWVWIRVYVYGAAAVTILLLLYTRLPPQRRVRKCTDVGYIRTSGWLRSLSEVLRMNTRN